MSIQVKKKVTYNQIMSTKDNNTGSNRKKSLEPEPPISLDLTKCVKMKTEDYYTKLGGFSYFQIFATIVLLHQHTDMTTFTQFSKHR